MKENIVLNKSFDFASDILELYKKLIQDREYVLSKQILKSGTSIGANINEACYAETKRDFIHKMHISQKETVETLYWLKLLNKGNYINDIEYSILYDKSDSILRLLSSIIITSKRHLQNTKDV